MAKVYGTNGNDFIYDPWGFMGNDTIYGYNGDDRIYGLSGDDTLTGGAGADYLDGGIGTYDFARYDDSTTGVFVSLRTGHGSWGTAEGDTLVGIEGLEGSSYDDILEGDDGVSAGAIVDDWLYGEDGNDWIYGGGGSDALYGGGGDDTILGGADRDWLYAGVDHDRVHGHAGEDYLDGSAGNDWLYGGADDDYLVGTSGNDTLNGGGGADFLDGGAGTDTADYTSSTAGVGVSLFNDTVGGGDSAGDELDGIENLTGSAFGDSLWGDDGVNVLQGMSGDDTLKGFGGADTIYGGDDSDSLHGMDGADYLDGGAGVDTMIGGTGSDTYVVDRAGDVVTESGGQGADTVRTSVSWVMTAGADIETLRTVNAAGVSAINLTGNASGNLITGNDGSNILSGRDGNDELTGLGGQDSFLFGTPLNAATNVDVITDFDVEDDTIVLDQAIFGGIGLGTVAGSQFVIGTAAQDTGDRIIYNDVTGAVYYDSDGTGAAAAIQFAELSPGLALTNFDFYVNLYF